MKLSEYLSLPEGFNADRYPASIELRGPWPYHKPVGMPVPYDTMTREEWITAAQDCLKKAGYTPGN